MLLEGKVALITGAASGIGAACARLFVEEGATVLLADIDIDRGAALTDELLKKGANVQFIHCNVAKEDDVAAMVDAAVTRFGRLDCAVNNAAIVGAPTPINDIDLVAWNQVINVNLTGVMLCLKHELKAMRAQSSGAIVNISSGAGLIAVPNLSAYCASKHAVLGLTKTAAAENAKKGIRVNAILPGSSRTPQLEATIANGGPDLEKMILNSVPCGRFGTPKEIAENIMWLCSDRASYVSGVSMSVDYSTICR